MRLRKETRSYLRVAAPCLMHDGISREAKSMYEVADHSTKIICPIVTQTAQIDEADSESVSQIGSEEAV